MKSKKSIKFLIALLLMFGVAFGATSTLSYNESYVPVLAGQSEVDNFVNVEWLSFREKNPDICNVSNEDYQDIIAKYRELDEKDKEAVNDTKDCLEADYTIGQLIQELVRTHNSSHPSGAIKKQKLDQSTTIIIAVVVSIFGMSAISVLYILKNKKVIE